MADYSVDKIELVMHQICELTDGVIEGHATLATFTPLELRLVRKAVELLKLNSENSTDTALRRLAQAADKMDELLRGA